MNETIDRRAVNRGVRLDAATNQLLAVMALRYEGNRSMAVRAAIRQAAQAWGVEGPPQKGGGT